MAGVYGDLAAGLQRDYPATAEVLRGMQGEEGVYRRGLIELCLRRFGEHIPMSRKTDARSWWLGLSYSYVLVLLQSQGLASGKAPTRHGDGCSDEWGRDV